MTEWSYYINLWSWRCLCGNQRDREELSWINEWFYFRMLSLDLPLARYLICTLFPPHDHMFHEHYPDYFMVNIMESVHACMCNRLLFPLLPQPGYEARGTHRAHNTVVYRGGGCSGCSSTPLRPHQIKYLFLGQTSHKYWPGWRK